MASSARPGPIRYRLRMGYLLQFYRRAPDPLYSLHEPQECGILRTDRNGPADSSFSGGFYQHCTGGDPRRASSDGAHDISYSFARGLERDAVLLRLPQRAMSHIKGLLRGSKFNGRHSTVIPSAIAAVEAAKACPHVTKIGLGVITPTKL